MSSSVVASTLAKSLPKTFAFPVIGLPHGNDAAAIAGRRPDHLHHAALKQPNCHKPLLRVVEPQIGESEGRPGEHLWRFSKIQAAVCQGCRSLRRIEHNLHCRIKCSDGTPIPKPGMRLARAPRAL